MDATPNELLNERIAKRKRQNVERVLRCRKRKRAGSRCVRIEVTDWAETLDAFVKIGVLGAEQRNDDKAIEAAIAVYASGDIVPSKANERRIEMTIALEMLSPPDRRSSASLRNRSARAGPTSPKATPAVFGRGYTNLYHHHS